MMIRKWFKVKTSDITSIQFIIEGYERMATVSTIDPKAAVIQVLIMPDFINDVLHLLDILKRDFYMEEIPHNDLKASLC